MNPLLPSSLANLRERIRDFIHERDWEQFHSPKNLAMSIAIEAAELMECFQWQSDGKTASSADVQHAIDELSDVLIYCMALANVLNINDLEAAVLDKLARSGEKYPVIDYKGKI
ncbi:MAG: nucleotide pyrophosphohydrolase [Anaerolineales bacterium]|nr:nucleotide pyrophosphohydrolase [Anaerolineales bacterium]